MRRVLTCIAVIASVLGNSYGMNFSQTEESGGSSQGSDPITEISKRTVRQLGKIGSRLDIPEGVGTIGFAAFSKNPIIGEVSIPSSVISIGGCAFHACTNLSKVFISPESLLENIGGSAFKDCKNLKSIFLPTLMKSIGSSAFENTGITEIFLTYSIGEIPRRAFANCPYLKTVEMGNLVTSIGDEAFLNCENLQNVNVPKSVVDIDSSAFNGCPNLTKESQASIMAVYDRQQKIRENKAMQDTQRRVIGTLDDLLQFMKDSAEKNPKLWKNYYSFVADFNRSVGIAIEKAKEEQHRHREDDELEVTREHRRRGK